MESAQFHHTLISKYTISNWLYVRTSHQHLMHYQCTSAVFTLRSMVPSQNRIMCQEHMTNMGVGEGNLALTRTSIERLQISQDCHHRTKFVLSHIIPFILLVRHDVFVNVKLKICIWDTQVGMMQVQRRLGSQVCFLITNMTGYPSKNNRGFFKDKKTYI